MNLALLAATVLLSAAPADSQGWLAGKPLQQQLQQPVPTIHWQDAPLRQAVEALARANRVAVLIDRRVDPGQPLHLSAEQTPLADVFRQVAESRGLAMGWIGPVLYFGPSGAGQQLETALELRRQELRKLPVAARRLLAATGPVRWSDFAEPRRLLEQLADSSGLEIRGLDRVPHDLWAAADLPPLSLLDRLGLIAGQFDLTVEIDAEGRRVTLVPFPDKVALVQSYAGGRDPEESVRQWRLLAPAGEFRIVEGRIFVRGSVEDHRRIGDAIQRPATAAPPPAAPGPQETRFTIREAKGPLRRLLEELAGRLGMEVDLDEPALEAAGISLDRQVSLSVADATLEQLFEALLKPAGCTFRLEGKTLWVRPAKSMHSAESDSP